MPSRPSTILRSVRIRNFKAIHDSRSVRLGDINVFVGNNGSGKSSLIEALEALQILVTRGLDDAMQRWHGIDHVRNKSREPQSKRITHGIERVQAIEFKLAGRFAGEAFSYSVAVTDRNNGSEILIEREDAQIGKVLAERDNSGRLRLKKKGQTRGSIKMLRTGESLIDEVPLKSYIEDWQILRLHSQVMGEPFARKLSRGRIRLNSDGSNIAEYLHEIREVSPSAFGGILDALRVVLPYSIDLQPSFTEEVQQMMYLQMTEQKFKIPGWMLSTGTLRVLALLAVLRHPTPPPLVVIEEIENGLDPRTIHLLVEEIRMAIELGKSQILMTTHSPYMMDLLPLSSIILCERRGRDVVFRRPDDDAAIKSWSEEFAPGQLYTMDRFSQKADR